MDRRTSGMILGLVCAQGGWAGGAIAGDVPKSTPELIAKGKAAYNTTCVACHGEKGDGAGPAAAALNPRPRDLTVKDPKVGGHYKQGGTPGALFKSISTGLPGTAMMPFGYLPEQDRWGLVYYITETLQAGKEASSK